MGNYQISFRHDKLKSSRTPSLMNIVHCLGKWKPTPPQYRDRNRRGGAEPFKRRQPREESKKNTRNNILEPIYTMNFLCNQFRSTWLRDLRRRQDDSNAQLQFENLPIETLCWITENKNKNKNKTIVKILR